MLFIFNLRNFRVQRFSLKDKIETIKKLQNLNHEKP